jgi:thiol-disulfide isomerase/thioredoxin
MKFISITPENNNTAEFMEVISKMPSFVKLYSPGCGHCVAMQDDWNALKNNAALTDYDMAVIEVHADELDKINSPAMTINQGFPTIRKVLKNGNLGKDYEGNRSTVDMINFIKENFPETYNSNIKSKSIKSKSIKSKRSNSKSIKSKRSNSKSKKRSRSQVKGGGKIKKTHRKTKKSKKSRRKTKRM